MKIKELNALIDSVESMLNFYIQHLDSSASLEEYGAWSEVHHSLLNDKKELLNQMVLTIKECQQKHNL